MICRQENPPRITKSQPHLKFFSPLFSASLEHRQASHNCVGNSLFRINQSQSGISPGRKLSSGSWQVTWTLLPCDRMVTQIYRGLASSWAQMEVMWIVTVWLCHLSPLTYLGLKLAVLFERCQGNKIAISCIHHMAFRVFPLFCFPHWCHPEDPSPWSLLLLLVGRSLLPH